jgi:arylsulfatase A-like enzyme
VRTSATLAAVLALSLAASCGAPKPSGPPNVLLLVMDTTRADRCGFIGYGRPTTPRLAEFAKDAWTFTDAWAPCCWTAPSHGSLFTGLRPEHHGLTEGVRPFLDEATPTIATILRNAGWRTGCFSNNEIISPEYGLTQGFEKIDPLYKDPDRPYPYATETHRRALEWALSKDGGGKPFFLFVNDMEPHLPYSPPPEFAAKFVKAGTPADEVAAARAFNFPWSVGYCLGRTVVPPAKLSILSDLYDGEIATLDAEIGTLLDGLKSAGVLDRTVVVVCADHGENLGEHRRMGHLLSMHRNTLHVPLLVRAPGTFDGGKTVGDVVRLEDVMPTILELCGRPVPAGLDGETLAKDLGGRVARGLFGEQSRTIPEMERAFPGADLSIFKTSIRSSYDGRLHYTLDSAGHEELYDVKADPAESKDLAPAGGDDVARMRALLSK